MSLDKMSLLLFRQNIVRQNIIRQTNVRSMDVEPKLQFRDLKSISKLWGQCYRYYFTQVSWQNKFVRKLLVRTGAEWNWHQHLFEAAFRWVLSSGIVFPRTLSENDFSKLFFPRKIPIFRFIFRGKISAEFSPEFSAIKMCEKSTEVTMPT
jgi:hypothetical protein